MLDLIRVFPSFAYILMGIANMFADYHIHTFLSGDAKGEILDYVKIAFSKKNERDWNLRPLHSRKV